jgi:Predicted ABC-type transport system involved in lysophospholipase L1 biosynthesis, permease component
MTEKKGRFLLLLFSIAVSTALFIFSLGAVDVILKVNEDALKNAADGKEVGISSNTEDVFFSEKDFDAAGLTNFEGQLNAIGIINKDDEITYVYLAGKKDCNKYVQEGSMPEKSSEPVCAISDRIAKERDLKLGDTIEVAIGGEKQAYKINAICAPSGSFYGDSKKEFTMVVPYDYMETIMSSEGRYNYMTAETSESDSVKAADNFNDANERVKAMSLTDLSSQKEITQSAVTTLYIMFAIVCIICCIIIHGTFKLIINERMTVIGTFMSQGATRKKIEHILLCESFLYSVFGAIFGVALGEVILYIIARETSPLKEYGIYMSFSIDPKLIIIGIIFAVLMSVVSALLPARSVRKLPVKDVILNRMEVKHKKGSLRFILGIALLVFAIVGAVINEDWIIDLSMFFTAAAFIGMIMLLPKFLKILSGIFAIIFKNNTSLFLAFNNVKTSKLLRGNITLLVISFSAVLLIASIGKTMADGVVAAYEKMNYDYEINNVIDNNSDTSTTDIIIDKLNSMECIDKDFIVPKYDVNGLIDDVNVFITGADPLKYAKLNEYLELSSDKYYKYFEELAASEDDSVIITDYVAKETGKDIGDSIEVDVDNKKLSLRIIGKYNGKLWNNGRNLFVKPKIIKKGLNIKEATSIAFNIVGEPDTAEKEFKGVLSDFGVTYLSKEDIMKVNEANNQQIVTLLGIFAIIAMIVASIGIFNNITISFQQRRKEFAVMSSVGMNAKKRKGLVLAENMYCVVISIALSIPFTILVIKLMSKVLIVLSLPWSLIFDWSSVPIYSAVLAVVIFIASLSTMKNSKKINVVQELKYE